MYPDRSTDTVARRGQWFFPVTMRTNPIVDKLYSNSAVESGTTYSQESAYFAANAQSNSAWAGVYDMKANAEL
ncbi:hypothetical protein [Vibrio phage vB_VhaP_PG11]|nr:hypothetical protein [Vibrio phage vB_VhaP_PG11]